MVGMLDFLTRYLTRLWARFLTTGFGQGFGDRKYSFIVLLGSGNTVLQFFRRSNTVLQFYLDGDIQKKIMYQTKTSVKQILICCFFAFGRFFCVWMHFAGVLEVFCGNFGRSSGVKLKERYGKQIYVFVLLNFVNCLNMSLWLFLNFFFFLLSALWLKDLAVFDMVETVP